jgi:hypothetical protein
MSNLNKNFIVNPENPNGILVDFTAEEIAENNALQQTIVNEDSAKATAKAEQDAIKVSGNQKLLDLGLTQAEASALTGYTPPVAE